MAKKQKDGLSIANIVSVIGVIIFGLLWGISLAYITFSMPTAILGGIGAAIVAAILLWLTISFKQKDSADPKWRIAEYICLGALVILLTGSIFPFSHFMGIRNDKARLQEVARADIENVRNSIKAFQSEESKYLNNTSTAMLDAFANGGQRDARLKGFMDSKSISSEGSVKSFRDDNSAIISSISLKDGQNGVISYNSGWQESLDEALGYVNSWNAFRLPIGIAEINNVNDEAATVLPKLAEELEFPIIRKNEYSIYTVSEGEDHPKPAEYHVVPEFSKALKAVPYFCPSGLLVAVIVGLLVAFNYICAPRSHRIAIGKSKNDNLGRLL
ncbi:MAG: hypothetical protein NC097_04540 [Clostridium sp.]|nr:hypothetical protein [Prevotella sp.]MCM1429046.1 hypothetical protein [Clostridium sp.]MCM1475423.1 hypothetical protein [Muribaculaceae bacterium]